MPRCGWKLHVATLALICSGVLTSVGQPIAEERAYFRNTQGTGLGVPPGDPNGPEEPTGPLTLSFDSTTADFFVGDPVSGTFIPTNAAQPVSYGSIGLPGGVTVQPNGALSGAFSSPGTYSGTVTIHDGLGRSASAPFSFHVAPVQVGATVPTAVRALAPVSGFIAADAGTGWSYSLSGGPGTVHVDPVSGTISGTSGSAQTTFMMTPRAQRNGVAVQGAPVAMQVTAPQFTVSGIPSLVRTGDVVSGYAEGADPGTFALVGAPSWMTIDANGTISGKAPSSPMSGNHDVKVNGSRDGAPLPQASFAFSVGPAYQIGFPDTIVAYTSSYSTTPATVTGPAGTGRVFSKSTGPSFVSVDPATGAVVVATDGASAGTYSYGVSLADGNGASGYSGLKDIYVGSSTLTVNFPTPGTTLRWHVGSPGSFQATAIGANVWSRTKPPFTDLVQGPPWVTLSQTGLLAAETSEPRASEPLTIYAYNSANGQWARRTFNVAVEASTLAVSGVGAVDVHVSSDIAAQSFTPVVSGALGQASWTLGAGTLPSGISVDASTGRLVGTTSSASGTFAGLKVRATDADGTYAESAAFTLTVLPAMTVTTTTAYSIDGGASVTSDPVTVANAFGSRTLSVETLGGTAPAFSLNQSTGVLTYTAPSGGSWVYRIRATDEAGGDVSSAAVTASYVTTELASTAIPQTANGAALQAGTFYSASGNGNLGFASRSGCSATSGAYRQLVYDFGKPVTANGARTYIRMSGGQAWQGIEGSNNGTSWTRVFGYTSRNYPNSNYNTFTDTFTAVSYRYWAYSTCGSDGTLGRFQLRHNGVSPNY